MATSAALKSASQPIEEQESLRSLLVDCLTLTYSAIQFSEEKGITSRKGMKEFYRSIKKTILPSCYKLAIITRACSIVKSRRKSETRKNEPRCRKPLREMVCITSGFFVTAKGRLFIPLQKRNEYADVLLNEYVREKIEGMERRSLTITSEDIAICYCEKRIQQVAVKRVYGLDRNEKNLTVGDAAKVVQNRPLKDSEDQANDAGGARIIQEE